MALWCYMNSYYINKQCKYIQIEIILVPCSLEDRHDLSKVKTPLQAALLLPSLCRHRLYDPPSHVLEESLCSQDKCHPVATRASRVYSSTDAL